jgi:hypothetical protein
MNNKERVLAAINHVGPDQVVRVCKGDELVFRDWPEKTEALAMVTYLKLDHAEAEVLTSLTDVHAAAYQITTYGPREIVLTHNGGVLVYADGQTFEALFTPRSLDGAIPALLPIWTSGCLHHLRRRAVLPRP